MSMMTIWIVIGIILLLIEIATIGLVSVWFAVGAFITAFFTEFTLKTQFAIFVLISLISLIIFRNMAMKRFKGKSEELDRITKKRVVVEGKEDKGSYKIYNVYLDGKHWSALCDTELEIGDEVEVKEIKGNKLILKK